MASDNTITDVITRAIQPESDSAHSFFSTFPREIRDQIYDLIFQEKTYPIHFVRASAAFYSKVRTTVPKVRLVCSRFKIEYDERGKHHLPKNHFRICQVGLLGFFYDIADLPLLKEACIHVSCVAKKRAIDLLPMGDPPAKIPMLAQISTFSNSYVQGSSQDVGVPPDKPEDSGGFVARRQTKAIWTHVNGWDNEAKLNTIRGREMPLGDRGMGIVLF